MGWNSSFVIVVSEKMSAFLPWSASDQVVDLLRPLSCDHQER
jgi:hypothetical protein